ncbi:MAG: ATP-binding protein [bacterium]
MKEENIINEYKSIQKIRTGDKGFKSLAETCVALANTQGGTIFIGIEDKTKQVPRNQIINDNEINNTITRLRSLCDNASFINSDILKDENGSDYFTITVLPTLKSIAMTSDGKIYKRVGDQCVPVRAEDVIQLSEEKGIFQWEMHKTRFSIGDAPKDNITKFVADIKKSSTVSAFIKDKTDYEILEYYGLIEGDILTQIGVLWLGNSRQRGALTYPITVQYIVYDQLERKIRNKGWHDNSMNPKELLLDIESKAVELTYFYEYASGMFRKQVPFYNSKVVRELIVNAFAHKSFTISQDVVIAVYPDRLEITNAGGLPLGITANNILHKQVRRNPHMIEIMKALKLMEGEGSGYDLVYELNAMEAKKQPIIDVSYGDVKVIQECEILDKEVLPLLDYITENYTLSQKEYIAFGTIAKQGKISIKDLLDSLQLVDEKKLNSYIDILLEDNLIECSNQHFSINPILIENSFSILTKSEGINLESEGINLENEGINLESEGINPKSEGINPESEGINPENEGINPESEGIKTVEIVLNTIKEKGGLNALQISELLDKSIKTIERNLKILKDENKIEFLGARKTGGYYFKK